MRRHIGATVTVDDLTQYFKGKRGIGDEWNSRVRDGLFIAECRTYTVELAPKDVMYAVEVSAYDDPSDSDSKVTDDPVEFLVDFLGTGTSGDDFFKKRSSMQPDDLRDVLVHLSEGIDSGRVGPRKLARVIRRAIIMTDVDAVRRIFAAALRFAESRDEFELKDLAKLKAEMSENGWKASVDEDDRGLPALTVDIGGVYKAKVTIDHILWHYNYDVNGTNVHDEGVTDDPISAFREFYRSEEVKKAKSEQKQKFEEEQKGLMGYGPSSSGSEEKTKKPAPPSGPEEGTRPAAPKSKPN
jgi:hypothetical protein